MKLIEKFRRIFTNFLVHFFSIRTNVIKNKVELNDLFFDGLLPPGDDADDTSIETTGLLRRSIEGLARNLTSLENRNLDEESRRAYEGNCIINLRNILKILQRR